MNSAWPVVITLLYVATAMLIGLRARAGRSMTQLDKVGVARRREGPVNHQARAGAGGGSERVPGRVEDGGDGGGAGEVQQCQNQDHGENHTHHATAGGHLFRFLRQLVQLPVAETTQTPFPVAGGDAVLGQ